MVIMSTVADISPKLPNAQTAQQGDIKLKKQATNADDAHVVTCQASGQQNAHLAIPGNIKTNYSKIAAKGALLEEHKTHQGQLIAMFASKVFLHQKVLQAVNDVKPESMAMSQNFPTAKTVIQGDLQEVQEEHHAAHAGQADIKMNMASQDVVGVQVDTINLTESSVPARKLNPGTMHPLAGESKQSALGANMRLVLGQIVGDAKVLSKLDDFRKKLRLRGALVVSLVLLVAMAAKEKLMRIALKTALEATFVTKQLVKESGKNVEA